MASDTPLFGAKLDRETITFSGPQAEQEEFLQSLVTNDVSKARSDALVYAALLTPQGKYLFDFLVLRTGEGDFVLDAAPEQAEALEKRLAMYRLRRPIGMVREPVTVAALWGNGSPPASSLPDPRDPELGWRVYSDDAAVALASATEGDYDLHRLKLAVPESGRDLVASDTYILEAGFERLSGVDFRKGCYVGQEIVARMKHKTELRKAYRLVAVTDHVESGQAVTTEKGKPAGTLYSNRNGIGLALIRLDRAESAGSLMADGTSVRVIQSKL